MFRLELGYCVGDALGASHALDHVSRYVATHDSARSPWAAFVSLGEADEDTMVRAYTILFV